MDIATVKPPAQAKPAPSRAGAVGSPSPSRRSRLGRWWWIGGGLGAALVGVLFVFDPATHGAYPKCAFHLLTGLECPGCGGLRAAHQLLHGRMGAAWELNPLVPLLPLAAAGVALWRWRRWPVPAFLRKSWAIWLGAGALIFTVFRNWKG